MTALDQLIEAVEAGEISKGVTGLKAFEQFSRNAFGLYQSNAAWRAYGGSLDAALALHEALLPGWRMDALWQGGTLCRNENDWSCRLRCVSEKRRAIGNDEREALPTPARAWLLAILRAYRSVQA